MSALLTIMAHAMSMLNSSHHEMHKFVLFAFRVHIRSSFLHGLSARDSRRLVGRAANRKYPGLQKVQSVYPGCTDPKYHFDSLMNGHTGCRINSSFTLCQYRPRTRCRRCWTTGRPTPARTRTQGCPNGDGTREIFLRNVLLLRWRGCL